MGAKFSPSFAIIFVAWWERLYVFSDSNPFADSVAWYGRYIDDVIMLWRSDVTAVPDLISYFNNNGLGLKFTFTHDVSTIAFLDLQITSNSITSKIDTCTYRKPTAGNTTLHAASCHPLHTVRSIPIGELVRAKRNCSNDELYHKECDNIMDRLTQRHYPSWMLNRAKDRVNNTMRASLLETRIPHPKKSMSTTTIFSTPFSRQFRQISNIIHKHIPMLHADPGFSRILTKGYKCVSKKAANLGNLLSPSLVTYKNNIPPTWLKHVGCFKCMHTRCICCNYVRKSNVFVSTTTKTSYPIKQFMNCATKYVVYLFTCKVCQVQYVGSTVCELKTRIRRHMSDINAVYTTNVSAVSRHAIETHNRDPSCFEVQAIERLHRSNRGGDDVHRLRNREAFWMFVLKTCAPDGLNCRADLVLHY